jgi:hypothetical protein
MGGGRFAPRSEDRHRRRGFIGEAGVVAIFSERLSFGLAPDLLDKATAFGRRLTTGSQPGARLFKRLEVSRAKLASIAEARSRDRYISRVSRR